LFDNTDAGPEFYTTLPEPTEKSTATDASYPAPLTPTVHRKDPLVVVADITESESEIDSEKDSEATTETAAVKTDATTIHCTNDCQHSIELMQLPFPLSDEDFEGVLADVDTLADYLRNNPSLVPEWIDLASRTDGNKRQVIIETFHLLDMEEHRLLGTALTESPNERHRLDGVQFLARSIMLDKSMVPTFTNILQGEQDQYVRGAAVEALNKPDLFHGDEEVLSALSQVIYSDTNDAVRGEALLASARLTPDPEALFQLSLEAVRSHTNEYQQYGVRALEEVLTRQTMNGGELSWQSDSDLSQLMEDTLGTEYKNMPAEVRSTLDDLYYRFF